MKWRAATIIILGILNILILLPKVLCSGVFELNLSTFNNSRGLDYDGNCCNGVMDSSSPAAGPICTQPCHTFFTICLTNYMANIPPDLSKANCLFGYVSTDVLGSNDVNFQKLTGFNNVISFHFNFSWPGTFSIIIEAWHDATLKNPVTGSPRERISRLAVQRELKVGPEWSNFIHKTDRTQLEYRYRVTCDVNYYDAGCSKLCRPRDDHFGHYTCDSNGDIVCMTGWTGAFCDQAICLTGCDPENGYCSSPYECKCRSGWEGEFCKECIKYPGCKNGTCTKPWECNCDEGWGGLYCNQDLNFCTHHSPCLNGGVCQNTGSGSYTCTCPEGFNGTNCEREVDDCLSRPCQNGGSCVDVGNGYQCNCPVSYTGKRCDIRAESCEKNPCKNGATCVEGQGSYSCRCRSGFTGYNCDIDINGCDPNPCRNNGRCIDQETEFKCVCERGFSGRVCEVNVDDCSNMPCRNGGTCLDQVNDFECRCVPGFVGDLCEVNVDDCETRPCAYGGICHDLVNDFNCTCRTGYTGKFCTIVINPCDSNPCRNGASCRASFNTYVCDCVPGFTGINCQNIPGQIVTTLPTAQDPTTEDVRSTTLPPVAESPQPIREDEPEFTTTQLLLIVCLGVGIPLLAIIIVVTILLCRRRRRPLETQKEQDDNLRNSINNKLRESKIFTTVPHSSSTFSNLTSKISNEDNDLNTLKSFRRPTSQIYVADKPINKQLIKNYNKDLQVHTRHRDLEKTSKCYDKENTCVTIDHTSNLDIRDYQSSPDIHFIDKHNNRDIINRNSLLILEPQLHQEPHRHSSYYGDDVLATEV
ncbi:delta-like protein 1 [Dreissena polymorpha]|uniref:Delta-like protein n=1 Tax=Dreissena polymorpha TaxID=45954 RepID=A0A9D4R1U9_DREPO|nr:delta-like protein 1 [Dreissena polymorpha]XP_052275444.1 delta-like protein 1 [Dreissena polymorpha]XP_052275445.1 delta-like protein 1 [Dreissena polymorpha]XP_052275446.1 delta-like protein 1 [Dreissena polymorpha]XP_052275447.1 delta-like protein 1 [Dreissena polymorpha]XP_052275448.1 delta-like protein 1 [Dreissena polymorpha]XP_052275449.1 delta-like protein 1 [Dreissena polymorpha]KAH3851971.1 hypothetical protein DPMN_094460 [Dreissena polymorpha]